jgi:hypothetical protein
VLGLALLLAEAPLQRSVFSLLTETPRGLKIRFPISGVRVRVPARPLSFAGACARTSSGKFAIRNGFALADRHRAMRNQRAELALTFALAVVFAIDGDSAGLEIHGVTFRSRRRSTGAAIFRSLACFALRRSGSSSLSVTDQTAVSGAARIVAVPLTLIVRRASPRPAPRPARS